MANPAGEVIEAQSVAEPEKPGSAAGPSLGTVLVLLFIVLGPLALGLLWKSPRFSRRWKVILTALTMFQLGSIFCLVWYVVHLVLDSLQQLGAMDHSGPF